MGALSFALGFSYGRGMRPRGQSTAHAEAVSRRLELLSAELRAHSGPETRSPSGSPPRSPSPDAGPGDDGHTHVRELRLARESAIAPDDDDDGWVPPPSVPPLSEPALPESSVVPGSPRASGPDAPVDLPAPALPVPGRHAARRTTRSWVDVSAFRGRVALTAGQVAALAVLVAVGLAITAWWVIRDDAGAPVAEPMGGAALATPAGGVPSASAPMSSGSASPSTELVVDVTGKVRRPGIVVLEPGARVVDALKAAGGVRRGVDLSGLNQARPLVDGEQIAVGVPAPPGVAATSPPSSGAPAGELVNLNTATGTELEELPGVGPVTAEAIIAWRDTNGGFQSVDQLLEVDGIGEKTLADLAPHVTL